MFAAHIHGHCPGRPNGTFQKEHSGGQAIHRGIGILGHRGGHDENRAAQHAVIATARRASLMLPVLASSQSVARPPTVSPTTPAQSGSDAKMPTLINVKCLNSTR